MRSKFRLLLTTAIVTLLLIACGSETNNTLGEEKTEETVEVQATETETEAADETAEDEATDSSAAETSSTEAGPDKNETTEETEETEEVNESTEVEESTESKAPTEEATEATETVNPLNQKAIEKILGVTDLAIEEYTYRIADETAEYIEVEIYEKTEQANTPREGIYRYFPETGEILVNDYLTGEYIPYDHLKVD